jgi:autotransporter-associated beta strand protein
MLSFRRSALVVGFVTVLASTAVVSVVIAPAFAVGLTWDNDADGGDGDNTDFNNPNNWVIGQGGGAVPGPGDIPTFIGAAVVSPNLSGSVTVQQLSFTAGSSGYDLSASPTFALTLTNTGTIASGAYNGAFTSGTNTVSAPIILGQVGSSAYFRQLSGGTTVLSGDITTATASGILFNTGEASLTGMFTLSGNNNFNGGTFSVGNATINIASNTALNNSTLTSAGANATLVNTTGSALTLNNPISLSVNNRGFQIGGTTAAEDLTFTGGLSFGSNTGFTGLMTVTNAGVRLGLGPLNVTTNRITTGGAGTVVLSGTGTGAGVTAAINTVNYSTVLQQNGGVLEFATADALGTATFTNIAASSIQSGADLTGANKITARFLQQAFNETIGGTNNIEFGGEWILTNTASATATILVTNTGTTTWSGTMSTSDLGTDTNNSLGFDVASTAGATAVTGVIRNNTTGSGGTGGVRKLGDGVLTLSGANVYTGTTTISGGTLRAGIASVPGVSGPFGNGGTVSLGNVTGATLDLNGFDTQIGNLSGGGVDGGVVELGSNTLTLAANTSATFSGEINGTGAVNKGGTGTWTFAGTNNSSGVTTITAGRINVAGAITGSVIVDAGTLDGTGTVGATTVADTTSAIIANSATIPTALTLSSLTFNGDATANIRIAEAAPLAAGIAVTGAMTTTPASGQVTINPTTDTGLWPTSGLVNLISYGSFGGGASASDFTLGTVNGLTTRQSTGGLVLNGNNVALVINGDAPKWTGKDDNNWATGLSGAMKNWELITAGTPTDYVDADNVLFDDSAMGSTSVSLGTAVAPSRATFNNSSKAYSISGGFSITSGSIVKNNTGSLTINNTNTYTGGTFFNGGTLNIGAAGALGAATSRLTIGPGDPKMLDNTSGAALTLSTNIPQTWSDDFTFLGSADGTHDLNMGTGTVTLTGATRSVTVNNGLLSIDDISSGTTTLSVNGAGALAIASSTLVGLTGNGILESRAGANRTITFNMSTDTTYSGSFRNSTVDGSTLALTKTGTGKLTLTGASTHTANTTITNGTLSVQNPFALGSGLIVLGGTSTGTLDIALDEFDEVGNLWQKGSGAGVVTLASGRATPGPGVNHNLSTSVIGSGTINVIAGSNVTSGMATLTINDVNITTGGAGGTTTFNPTTANLILPDVDNGGGTGGTAVRTLDLGGTTTGNILGNMTWQSGTSLGLAKSNTSTWTITGIGNYNGTTVISDGVLNVGDGGTSGSLGTGTITNNATLNFNRSDALAVASGIEGTTGIINQVGAGTTTLNGSGAYSGAININAGGLAVNGSLPNSVVALNAGTLDGTGAVGAVTVADSATNVVANGNGASGDLTFGSLTFSGDATVEVRTSSPGLVVTGALTTTPASGTVTINPTTATGTWANGPNDLISYGSLVGSLSDYTLGTITGTLGPRQSYGSLLLNGNNIALNVIGDAPVWTGAVSNQWTTAAIANPKNWKLITAGTNTDYIEGDIVTFDDTALGNTTVDINAANVSPSSVEFNNTSLNYTIGSSGGFGISGGANILKTGTGTVTISTNNTYSGTTTVSGGTLTLSGTNTSTAATTVNPSGTLRLDFSASTAPASDIVGSGSPLTLGGAALNLIGKANTNNSQTVASLQVNAGGSTINLAADPTANPIVLNLGTITRSTGASVIFTLPAGGQDFSNGITTTNPNFNGLLGPGGIVSSPGVAANNSPDGYTFATVSGGNIVPYTFATPLSMNGAGFAWGGIPAGGDGTINYDVDATFPANIGASRNVNSIRYTGTGLTQTGSAALTINGFMNAGTGPVTIGQPLTVGVTLDLTLAAASAPINVTTAINNNGSNPSSITLTGPNTVTLTGTSNYSGSTNVNGGTLAISGSGSIEQSSGININGSGAKLVYTSSTPSSRPIALVQGSIDGAGNVGAVAVADNPSNLVANGNGGTSLLSMSSLTYSGAGRMHAHVNAATPTNAGLSAAALTADGTAGSVLVDASPLGAWSYNTTYSLANYGGGSIGGTGFSAFTLGTVDGLSSRTTATLGDNGTAITLAIGASGSVVWTGLDNSNWIVGATGASKNWKLQSDNSPTDFIDNDDVIFDDTGTNTALNVSGAAVNVAHATFNNSSVPYSINGSGIASGGLTKNGTGSLTINTANTYSLGTGFNGGTLNIGNAGALGSGLVTIGAGSSKTLNNTSGGPLTLTTSVAQNWNDDFAFTGTSDLNMGSGLVSLAGAGSSRTVTVNSGTLQVGSIRSATLSGVSLTKSGAGALVSDGDSPNAFEGSVNVNAGSLTFVDQAVSVTGNLNVNGGTFTIGGPGLAITGDLHVAGGATATVGSTPNTTGLSGSGTINNGTLTNGALVVSNSMDKTFSGVIEDGTGGGTLGLTKAGLATLTLAGNSTFTGNIALQFGKLVMAHENGLGGTSPTKVLTLSSSGTLEIATDNIGGLDTAYQITMGSGTTTNIISNRATPGPGISHPITTTSDPTVNALGTGTINITSGPNVTSGMGNINFLQLNTSAGSAGTLTLNPTTATVTVGTATKSSAGAAAVTFGFGGTTTGNEVTGTISDGVAAVISVAKSNSSTWTLSGDSTYTGGTTVTGGTLLVNNTTGSGTGTGDVTVSSGATLGGTGIIAPNTADVTFSAGSNLAPGTSAGTLTYSPTTSGTFSVSGIVNTGGLNFELGTPGPGTSDQVVLTSGTLNVGTLNFADFTFTDIGGVAVGNVYTLFDAVSSITGSVGTAVGTFGGFSGLLTEDETNFDIRLTITLPGDYNADGKVNGADYVLWRNNPTLFGGTPDGYNVWRANFGNPPGAGSSAPGEGGAVPEPGTFALLCLSSLAIFARRRMRRR